MIMFILRFSMILAYSICNYKTNLLNNIFMLNIFVEQQKKIIKNLHQMPKQLKSFFSPSQIENLKTQFSFPKSLMKTHSNNNNTSQQQNPKHKVHCESRHVSIIIGEFYNRYVKKSTRHCSKLLYYIKNGQFYMNFCFDHVI